MATAGAVGSLLLSLLLVGIGSSFGDSVYSGHGLGALTSLVWAAGINAGLLAIAATTPVLGWPLLGEHHRFKSQDELVSLLPVELQALLVGSAVLASQGQQDVEDQVTLASADGAGRGDAHGDGGRELSRIEERISEAQQRLAELERTQGPKKEKDRLRRLIRNLREAAERARKGETHGRRGRGQQN